MKLSNWQLNKFKSEINNGTGVTFQITFNVAGYSNVKNNFLHQLLLTNAKVSKLLKTFLQLL